MNTNKSISILGCGWLGFALAKSLIQDDYEVMGSTTTSSKLALLRNEGIDPYLIDLSLDVPIDSTFLETSTLIINIPPGRKDPGVLANYPNRIEKALTAAKSHGVQNVLLVSSTGVYASAKTSANDLSFPEYITEPPNAQNGSSEALIAGEKILSDLFQDNGTIVRFGGLVGGDRIAARFLAGKKDVRNGLAPVNMIHRADCLGILRRIVKEGHWGMTFNATADEHPSRSRFYTQQAIKYELEPPTFLKEEFVEGKVISNNFVKEVLQYQFVYPDPMEF